MLHGNPASMHDFKRLASELRDEFELLAIDLPGFGRSDNAPSVRWESTLDSYARHVVAALDAIGWTEPIFVLGHSHGAAVAQAIATLFPERVRGLVLLGSVGTPAHWGYRQLVVPGTTTGLGIVAKTFKRTIPRALRWRIIEAIMTPIFAPHPVSDAWVDEQLIVVEARPEILVNMALVAAGDPCEQLARGAERIVAPALFIHGDSDRLVPASHARSIHRILASSGDAEFHLLPNTGHMLHLSHPESIRDLVLDWRARLFREPRRRRAVGERE
jgi:pimeloyl-ACP methyl ester carboxylesterase